MVGFHASSINTKAFGRQDDQAVEKMWFFGSLRAT